MGLESGTYIDDLVVTNPTTSDQMFEGDDHIRLIKSTLKNTFPGLSEAVTIGSTETPTFGSLKLTEAAAAGADTAGKGQFWVKNDTPNNAYFTDDAGNDRQLAYAGGAFHDGFSDFVADEHVAHTGVVLTAGTGLTGGGDISASRSFAVTGVLEDISAAGANANDGDFLVGTGAGAVAWENAATAFASIKQAATDSATGVVELATTAELRAGTSTSLVITPDNVLSAAAWVALSDAATITVDHAAGVNRSVTIAGNRTMGAPSNVKVGWPLNFRIKQDGTGSRTMSWNSVYDFGDAGAPTLSTAAGAEDLVTFIAITATKFAYLGIRKEIE